MLLISKNEDITGSLRVQVVPKYGFSKLGIVNMVWDNCFIFGYLDP